MPGRASAPADTSRWERATRSEATTKTRERWPFPECIFEFQRRIQLPGLAEEEGVAMQRVRAALGYDVDRPAGCSAALRRPAIRHDLKFANDLERELGTAGAAEFVVIGQAIDCQQIAPRTQAREAESAVRQRGRGRGGSSTRLGWCDAWGQ